jgi:hypothetical protein
VEFLWFQGCPSWERALADLGRAMLEQGFDPDTIERRRIDTQEQAEAERFPGSPTIRVNGDDIAPDPGRPCGLACRIYRRPDGRVSPLPDPADVRSALAAVAPDSGSLPPR